MRFVRFVLRTINSKTGGRNVELKNRTAFTDIDYALEETQFLVDRDKIPYSIIRVRNRDEQRIYVVPSEIVMEIEIIETFNPVSNGPGT